MEFSILSSKIAKPQLYKYLIDNTISNFHEQTTYTTFIKYLNNKYNCNKYTINDLLQQEMAVIDTRHSDLRIYFNRVPTLRAGRHGILYVKNSKLRKISAYEALLLQGFPSNLAKKATDEPAQMHVLKQAGNAITVNVIEAIAKQLFISLKDSNFE